jgi:beta propeller repeat protein
MYDISKDSTIQITTNSSNQKNPYVYGDKVLWEDYRNGNADIYMYNTTTSITIQLTNNSENQTAPAAYGDRFVWEDDRSGNQDIYMYNLTYLLTLPDNSPIYYNNDNHDIYVWKVNERYYGFNETSNSTVNTTDRPLNGYKYQELYEGTDPLDPDS